MNKVIAVLATATATILFGLLRQWMPWQLAAFFAAAFGAGYYWVVLWLEVLQTDEPPPSVLADVRKRRPT